MRAAGRRHYAAAPRQRRSRSTAPSSTTRSMAVYHRHVQPPGRRRRHLPAVLHVHLRQRRVDAGHARSQGVINARRKKRARRDEIPQWRYQRQSTIIVTDERLMCSGPDGTLIDFWFGYVTEFYPDLLARTVTFAFGDRCLPLQVAGAPAVAIALWSAHALYGKSGPTTSAYGRSWRSAKPRRALPQAVTTSGSPTTRRAR